MKLHNVVVQFTITIPEIEVDKELGLLAAKVKLNTRAANIIGDSNTVDTGAIVNCKIIDCPDYPALITQP